VFQEFPAGAARSLARHPAFKPAYYRSGPVPQIYGTGNCLIRRSVFDRLGDPSFDSTFNFTGGGDTDFFTRARRAGCKFYWAQDAALTETVPAHRTRLSWLARRGMCIGASNYFIDRKRATTPWRRALLVTKCAAIIPLSLVRAAGFAASGQFRAALHPINLMTGRTLALLGIKLRQYGRGSTGPESGRLPASAESAAAVDAR
jgi:GT2 family glycosyltransferase